MSSSWQTLRPTLPGPLLTAFALTTGFFAFVAWDQSHWWGIKEDYAFGWLVPVFVGFVVYDRRARIAAVIRECESVGSVRVAGWTKALLWTGVAGSLAGGVLVFLLGAFYRAGAGTSQPGTLAITLGAVGIALPLVFLNAPDGETPARCGSLFEDARVRLAALFLFPTLVWLVSAPMVSAIESRLNLFLLRQVVTVVSFVFELLGLPVEQQGNVLLLPSGRVGVEDACSGIRSLTGCVFAGSFLGAVLVERLWQKLGLIAAAVALAFLGNLLRGLFLTGWAYRSGPESVAGRVHDVAGYGVLGLTVLGLFALLPLFRRHPGEAEKTPVDATSQGDGAGRTLG